VWENEGICGRRQMKWNMRMMRREKGRRRRKRKTERRMMKLWMFEM
jgi:hypothetical protein